MISQSFYFVCPLIQGLFFITVEHSCETHQQRENSSVHTKNYWNSNYYNMNPWVKNLNPNCKQAS